MMVLADGFEEIEMSAPLDILRRLGMNVRTAALKQPMVTGAHGLSVQADSLLSEVDFRQLGGVILPGGPASWVLKETEEVLTLVREMDAAGKLVAAICAAPMVLAEAGILRGRKVTCYPAPDVRQAVLDAGGELQEAPAVTDGMLITGRGPAAALEFGYAIANLLVGKQSTASLQEGMCYPPYKF